MTLEAYRKRARQDARFYALVSLLYAVLALGSWFAYHHNVTLTAVTGACALAWLILAGSAWQRRNW